MFKNYLWHNITDSIDQEVGTINTSFSQSPQHLSTFQVGSAVDNHNSELLIIHESFAEYFVNQRRTEKKRIY